MIFCLESALFFIVLLMYLGLGLDGSTVFQQELDDADVAVPGCTVKRSQLVLHGDEFRVQAPSATKETNRSEETATLP